jgi:hypothetical protein
MDTPTTFSLYRNNDESGISGTGRILDGTVFHTGQVVTCWRTDIEGSKHGYSSLGVYDSWDHFQFLHLDSHPDNDSSIVWHTQRESLNPYPMRTADSMSKHAVNPDPVRRKDRA